MLGLCFCIVMYAKKVVIKFVANLVAVIGNIMIRRNVSDNHICNIPPSIYAYWQMIVVEVLCS